MTPFLFAVAFAFSGFKSSEILAQQFFALLAVGCLVWGIWEIVA